MNGAAFPRAQHWTTGRDGFRVSVLVYKTLTGPCTTCGTRPATHSVWADGRGQLAGFSGGPAHFCDTHRPAKGPLPPLDYKRIVHGGNGVTVYEWLPVRCPPRTCLVCDEPALFQISHLCQGCDDPARHGTTQLVQIRPEGVTTHPPERVHSAHVTGEWWACTRHTPAAAVPA